MADEHYFQSPTSRLFSKIVDYPRILLAVLLLISAIAYGGYHNPAWPSQFKEWVTGIQAKPPVDDLPGGVPQRSGRFRGISASLNREMALLVIQSDQLFTYAGAQAMRSIVAELESMQTVRSVNWLENAPPLNIFGLPEPVIPRGPASPQRFAVAKEKAVKNPLVVGQMLSRDAKTTVMTIRFNWPFVQRDEDCSDNIVLAAKEALKNYPDVEMKLSVTGPVPIRLMLEADRAANERKFQAIAYAIIFVMAIILFRGVAATFVVALAPVIGVLWTLGFLRYFNLHENPFSSVIVPVLVSLVGFADTVHMVVFLRGQLKKGESPVPACRKTLAAVGLASFLTCLTTSVGMASLQMAQHEVVQEFGWACVIGAISVWVSSMLVIPLACYTPWASRIARGADTSLIEKNLTWFAGSVRTVLKYPRQVSYFAIGLTIVLTLFALQLRPNDRTANLMPVGSPAAQTLAVLDQAFGGLEVCRVAIHWTQDKSPEEVSDIVTRVDEMLDAQPLIGHPISVCRLLRAMPGEDPPREKMSLVELLPPQLRQLVLDSENREANITFRVQDLGTEVYKPVFETLQHQLDALAKEFPTFRFEMMGAPIWKWKNVYRIITDLMASLATGSSVIVIIMALAFRSLRLGFIAILPNTLPLAAAACVLVLQGKPLEVASVCALTIALGIATDDTIHFVTRYLEEQRAAGTRDQQIERAFEGVGTGMIMTAIVLVAGFGSVFASSVPEHKTFATMGVATLISALLCDLFMLPALISYYDKPSEPKV